jgi:Arc/MetJ family transcription regulator
MALASYILTTFSGYTEVVMTKTLIDIDDEALDCARQVLQTTTKKATVNGALAEVAALGARRRDLERFATDAHADLRNADIMSSAWQR